MDAKWGLSILHTEIVILVVHVQCLDAEIITLFMREKLPS